MENVVFCWNILIQPFLFIFNIDDVIFSHSNAFIVEIGNTVDNDDVLSCLYSGRRGNWRWLSMSPKPVLSIPERERRYAVVLYSLWLPVFLVASMETVDFLCYSDGCNVVVMTNILFGRLCGYQCPCYSIPTILYGHSPGNCLIVVRIRDLVVFFLLYGCKLFCGYIFYIYDMPLIFGVTLTVRRGKKPGSRVPSRRWWRNVVVIYCTLYVNTIVVG
jgi:hypothetical protein